MGFIFFLSSQPDVPVPAWFSGQDKLFHVVLYLPLGFLMSLGLAHWGLRKNLVIYVSLLALLYGVTDEVHQYFVPGRDASVLDLIADLVGGFGGSLAFTRARRAQAS